jgi:hypothetical protein
MTPQQLAEFDALKKLVDTLVKGENVPFIQNLERRLNRAIRLSDLSDVSGTDAASVGQVLKKTSTTWQPGTDIDT